MAFFMNALCCMRNDNIEPVSVWSIIVLYNTIRNNGNSIVIYPLSVTLTFTLSASNFGLVTSFMMLYIFCHAHNFYIVLTFYCTIENEKEKCGSSHIWIIFKLFSKTVFFSKQTIKYHFLPTDIWLKLFEHSLGKSLI